MSRNQRRGQGARMERRTEATARQMRYNLMTTAERLDVVKSRRGESRHEVARLSAKLEKERG